VRRRDAGRPPRAHPPRARARHRGGGGQRRVPRRRFAARLPHRPRAVRIPGSTALSRGDVAQLEWPAGAQHHFGPDGARRVPAGSPSGETMLA
jgi:hypothetical protein